MAKTTAKHFGIFRSECLKWIGIFGLTDWHIEVKHKAHRVDALASIWSDTVNRLAYLYLEPDWGTDDITEERLRLSAFHEVCEVLVTPLNICARSRFINESEIDEATHIIVRTLENVLYPKY